MSTTQVSRLRCCASTCAWRRRTRRRRRRLAQELQEEQLQLQKEHARTVGELQGQGTLVEHLSEQARGHSDELARAAAEATEETKRRADAANQEARAQLEAQLEAMRREFEAKLEAARAEGVAQGRAQAAPAPVAQEARAEDQEEEEEEEEEEVEEAAAVAAVAAPAPAPEAGPSRSKKTRTPTASKKCTPPKGVAAAGVTKPRKYKVYVHNAKLQPQQQPSATADAFGQVPWFAHMGVTNKTDLQARMAQFDIQKRNVTDPKKVQHAKAQSSYKAQGIVALLWCEEAGRQEWWETGNVESLLRFMERTTWSDMAPKAGTKRYFNQDHRVACLFWGDVITDYASFQNKANEYAVRKARGYVTGTRLLREMYVAWKGGVELPPLPDPPGLAAAAPRAAGKKRAAPARPRAAPARKKPEREAPADSSDEDEDGEGSDSDAYSEHSEDSAGDSSSEEDSSDEEGEEGEEAQEEEAQEEEAQEEEEEEELSEYEQQRLRNIAANKRRLVALGLEEPEEEMPESEAEASDSDEAAAAAAAAAAVSPAAPAPTTAAAAFFRAMAGRT